MVEASPVAPLPPIQATAVADSRHNRWFYVGYYLLAVLWGIRSIYHSAESRLELLIPVALAICLGWWAVTDARRRRHPIPLLAQSWFFLLAFLVVPGYVIWSRGWRGGGVVILHILGWCLLSTVAPHVGGLVTFGQAWLRALGL